ncbi:thimet oligopeptidase-like isoform X2 [Mya arenaria]|nr:thimet oligopeptidase-like isoform X2 [Mya arenaria]
MSKPTMEGVRLRWNDITVDRIKNSVDELISKNKKIYDKVGSVSAENASFETVIKPLIDCDREYAVERNNLDFVQHVFPDKKLRDVSVEADKTLSEFDVEVSMRQDVFQSIVRVEEKGLDGLTPEQKRYVERQIKIGKRNGLHLSKEMQDEIKGIKKKMSDLSIDFSKNLNEENTILEFTEEELVGVPETFIKSLEKTADDKCKLSLKYPHYFPCMKKCRNPKTRQKLENAFNSRCMTENTKILEELVKLRHEKAQILGFETHAEFVLDMRMAKNPDKVKSFLSDLAKKLEPLKKKDLEKFLKFKKHECEEFKYENDGTINMWDYRYYMTMVEEKEYAVDQNVLKEYFPLDAVTRGLLDIYQKLLGLKFEKIMSPEVWHPGVTMYSVRDKASSVLLGYFYLDLFPREGKYGHAACFGLQPGCVAADGSTRQVSVAAMVANFTEPQVGGEDSLLTHDEVETFFHEFGHVMHQICAQTETAFFSGTHVERDFVEAPSQMLENWCWEEKPLRHMSRHFKDGSAIPKEILDKLIASRKANAGVFNLRQILLGTFDQTIHTMAEADTAKLFSKLSEELLGFKSTPGTNMPASFGHLAGGYDAQYYGYMWSEVYCMDMFEEHFSKGRVMDPEAGAAYRKCILQPGGSKDAFDMLRDFLGREPKQDAFLRSKGLEVDSNL